MNALVWTTFPRAKQALHARQHRLIEAWLPEGALVLPNARTPAQDVLAIVDEGGVLVLRCGDRERAVPFGHALFEGLVFEMPSVVARAVHLDVEALPTDENALLEAANRALAKAIDGLSAPAPLPRYPFTNASLDEGSRASNVASF